MMRGLAKIGGFAGAPLPGNFTICFLNFQTCLRNLAIEEREAREKREPQASQATENTRREAKTTARRTRAKHHAKPTWREQREHQDCECGGSRAALARALRALAGRLELERFVSFSSVFFGAFWLDPGEG